MGVREAVIRFLYPIAFIAAIGNIFMSTDKLGWIAAACLFFDGFLNSITVIEREK